MMFLDEVRDGMEDRSNFVPGKFSRFDAKAGVLWKKMLYLIGANPKVGKCFSKDTKILMFDGSVKNVQDVRVGDLLMGADSKPRTVLRLGRGIEEMFQIHQKFGDDYVVNKSHILSLRHGKRIKRNRNFINLSVSEYLTVSVAGKDNLYGWFPERTEFPERVVPLDPYLVGLYIGDGTRGKPSITNTDQEIIQYLYNYSDEYRITKEDITYRFTTKGVIKFINQLTDEVLRFNTWTEANRYFGVNRNWGQTTYFKEYVVKCRFHNHMIDLQKQFLYEKYIPTEYFINSYENRLYLLTGLIDSDGYYNSKKGHYQISTKYLRLSRDIFLLCRSLGFRVSVKEKIVKKSIYYIIHINPGTVLIPSLLERKKNNIKENKYPTNQTTISVKSVGIGEYFGFEIDGDKLFLLSDFTVVHNTAFVDERYVLYPYLNLPSEQLEKLHYKYFSYEIDIVEKMANYASYFLFRKHNLRISADTILGRIGKLTPREFEIVQHIYNTDLTALFGKFDIHGRQVEPGIIEFFQTKENPTGIMKRLFSYAASRGHFEYEKIEGDKKGRRLWYEPYSQYKDNLTIIILDHVGLVPRERGFSVKENIDKLSEYFVELRNECKFTFIVTSQFNRELSKTDRLRFSGEQLAPTLEDFKNTSNLAEDFQ